ncbi:MAG: ATP-binding protein [bacterium]
MKFRDLKLGVKQMIGFGVVLVMMVGANIFSLNKMAAIKAEMDEVTTNRLPRALAIAVLNLSTMDLRINQLQHASTTDSAGKREQAGNLIALMERIEQNIDTYGRLKDEAEARGFYSQEESARYAVFVQKWSDYQDLSGVFFKLSLGNRMQDALDLLNGEARQLYVDYSGDLVALVEINKKDALAAVQRAEQTFSATRHVNRLAVILTTLASVLFAFFLTRLIGVPVGQLAAAAETVAQGNLDVQLPVRSRDEIGTLAHAFNQMTTSLREARAKMEKQAATLQGQQKVLQAKNLDLAEKSEHLAQQKAEIERKNEALERTMSQLKKTQSQLVQSEKMASLGQLTAGIAHEINNPVNFVSSNVNPLKRDLVDVYAVLSKYADAIEAQGLRDKFGEVEEFKREIDLPFLQEEINRLLKGIEEGAQRTTEIVKGLRNFSRLDEDVKKLASINQGLESTVLMLKHQLKNRIEVVKDFGALPEIWCFPGKLNQAFVNILANAAQAIEGRGKIHIKTGYDGEIVTISIKDTGKGMTPEVKQRIFEPFFTTKDIGEGTGLGLSITFGIIEDHDGNIEVYSAPDQGTEVVITLPARA